MRMLMHRFALGAIAGGLFLGALLLFDIGGLGSLLAHDRAVFVPVFMLLVDLCGLFGMVVMITSLAEEDENRPAGRPAFSPNLMIPKRAEQPHAAPGCSTPQRSSYRRS